MDKIVFNKTRKSVDEAQNRRQFLKNLAMSLMKPHLQDRAQLQNLPSDIQFILSKYKPQSTPVNHLLQNLEKGAVSVEELKTG